MKKKYIQLGLQGIAPETKLKLKLLSLALGEPMTKLVDMMTEKLWKENQGLLSSIPQVMVNKETRKVLENMSK